MTMDQRRSGLNKRTREKNNNEKKIKRRKSSREIQHPSWQDRQKVPHDRQGNIKDIPLDRKAERARHHPLGRAQQDTCRHHRLLRVLERVRRELFPVLDRRLVVHQLVDVRLLLATTLARHKLLTAPLRQQRKLFAHQRNLARTTPHHRGGSWEANEFFEFLLYRWEERRVVRSKAREQVMPILRKEGLVMVWKQRALWGGFSRFLTRTVRWKQVSIKIRSSGVKFMIRAINEGRNMAIARQMRIISSLSILFMQSKAKQNQMG